MTVIASFPLLRLPTAPNNALLRTIRLMDDGVIALSLTSKKCKDLVVSLNLKTNRIVVFLRNCLVLSFDFNKNMFQLRFDMDPHLGTPQSVSFDFILEEFRNYKWNHNSLGLRDWLEHIHTIFHYSKIDHLGFQGGSEQFDVESVRKEFPNVKSLEVYRTGPSYRNEVILKQFSPIEKLNIDLKVFKNLTHPHKLLMQNFTKISIDLDFGPAILTLNDLLLMNSKRIITFEVQISPKEFNEFVKLWMKGSNPRMEWLSIACIDTSDQDFDIMMKDINYREVSPMTKRVFMSSGGSKQNLKGGFDIVRKDGTRATIIIDDDGYSISWEMFVWFHHCIVTEE